MNYELKAKKVSLNFVEVYDLQSLKLTSNKHQILGAKKKGSFPLLDLYKINQFLTSGYSYC